MVSFIFPDQTLIIDMETTNNIKKDFIKFHQSRPGIYSSSSAAIESKMNGLLSPSIMEERELHVTQLDVFSRLMMDRIIFFGTEVNSDTSNIVVSQLLYLASIDDRDITMYINSPGGSVYDGLGIVDSMMFIKPKVKTCCTGLAASMGSILLACGSRGERSILPHARVMIHQPMGGIQGQASDIEITAKEILKLKEELFGILSDRTGRPIEEIMRDGDRDHWLTAQEAKDYGIVDSIYNIDWNK